MRLWLNLWCCEGQPNQFLKMGVGEKTVSVSQWSNKSLRCYYLSPLISITYSAPLFSLHLVFLFPSFIVLYLSICHVLHHSSASFHVCFSASSLMVCLTNLPLYSSLSLSPCILLFLTVYQQHAWYCKASMEAPCLCECIYLQMCNYVCA